MLNLTNMAKNFSKFNAIVEFFTENTRLPAVFVESWLLGIIDGEELSPFWFEEKHFKKIQIDDDIWNTWSYQIKTAFSKYIRNK